MSATNFNTKNDTYRKLMGNGLTYRVPRLQRDYSWSEEEWDDLWQDIVGTVAEHGEPAHYMGYLVLQSADDKIFDIIDGQQRLTTLSILVLVALRQLKRLVAEGHDPERTQQRLDGLRQTYIGYLDPVTLVARSKLSLNRNNNQYYQTYLVPLVETLPVRGFKASEQSLRKASEWFERHVRDYIKGKSDPGKEVAQLIDTMSDRLFFTVITVNDELNAYKVFETLNARGVRLSSTDLLKNYLFSVLHSFSQHEREMEALDQRWEGIVGRLGPESFPDFLRVHWISRRSFVRQSDLFKTIRKEITGRDQVFSLLSALEEDMDVYLALTNPAGSDWSKEAKDPALDLRMFGVKSPLPLLLAARRRLAAQEFEALLRAIVILSFRYNIIANLQTSDQERLYHAEAERIYKGEHVKLAAILEGIRGLYPSDDNFRAAFAEKTMSTTQSRNRKILRYILGKLDYQMSGTSIDTEASTLTLEHILPTNPGAEWDAFRDDEIESFAQRLGNLALLEKGPNKDVGNAAFAEKRNAYATSNVPMTRRIAEQNDEWTPERIAARQNGMANAATGIWRVAQLA